MISSSHKDSNREGTKSIFHNFCPGLPVSLTLNVYSFIIRTWSFTLQE